MRILHVIESLGMGGAERHLANILGPLQSMGVENHVAALWPGSAYEESIRPYARVCSLNLRPRRVAPALPPLVRLARDVDVVHTQLPWADIAGRMAAVAARKPCVTTLQSTWYDDSNLSALNASQRRRARWVRRLDAFTARWSEHFFAVSAATRETYVRELGVSPAKIEVISNTVDLNRFNPTILGDRDAIRAELGCGGGELVVIMVARLVPAKGHVYAIDAMARINRSSNVRLYLVGDGPEAEQLRARATACAAPVVFLGARADVPRLMHAADVFLFPSIIEGMPLALLEAMAMGLPCVCSDIPENREAADDCAIYTRVGDVEAIATAVERCRRDDALRARFRTAARDRASQFSADVVAQRVLASIRRVLPS